MEELVGLDKGKNSRVFDDFYAYLTQICAILRNNLVDEEKKTPTFIKRPVFKIKVGASNAIDVDLGGDLEFKKSYSYTIVSNVKIKCILNYVYQFHQNVNPKR